MEACHVYYFNDSVCMGFIPAPAIRMDDLAMRRAADLDEVTLAPQKIWPQRAARPAPRI